MIGEISCCPASDSAAPKTASSDPSCPHNGGALRRCYVISNHEASVLWKVNCASPLTFTASLCSWPSRSLGQSQRAYYRRRESTDPKKRRKINSKSMVSDFKRGVIPTALFTDSFFAFLFRESLNLSPHGMRRSQWEEQ